MGPFRLQFAVGDISELAARYDCDSDQQVATAGASVRERGYYTKPELVLVCEWKTVRSRSRVADKTAAFVEGITRVAFATEDESQRMAALCALRGVNPPTASVLLHFAFPIDTPSSTGGRSSRLVSPGSPPTRSTTGSPTSPPARTSHRKPE
jgi:hypothetical protein